MNGHAIDGWRLVLMAGLVWLPLAQGVMAQPVKFPQMPTIIMVPLPPATAQDLIETRRPPPGPDLRRAYPRDG